MKMAPGLSTRYTSLYTWQGGGQREAGTRMDWLLACGSGVQALT